MERSTPPSGARKKAPSLARPLPYNPSGFNVLLWRDGELGCCLVSDLNRTDLDALAVRIVNAAP